MPEYTNPSGGVAQPKPSSAKRGKARAYKMEVGLAKDLRENGDLTAARVPMSGALKGVGLDGDVSAKHFLVEAKNYTPVEAAGGRYLKFDVTWLTKVMKEAALHGKPGLVVYQPKGAQNKLVVMDWDQFLAIIVKALR